MERVNWRTFDSLVRDGAGRWVTYPASFASKGSATSTAHILRKRFPDFEIKQSRGVIEARLRMEA